MESFTGRSFREKVAEPRAGEEAERGLAEEQETNFSSLSTPAAYTHLRWSHMGLGNYSTA